MTNHTNTSLMFKLVVLSLFSTAATNNRAMGLVQSSSLRHNRNNIAGAPHIKSHTVSTLSPSFIDDRVRKPTTRSSSMVQSTRQPVSSSTPTSSSYSTRKTYKTPTLSREEEMELLRQVFEYRRITKLEQDLALSPKYRSGTTPLMLSVKSNQAGYGDEFDMYEQAKYDGQIARERLVTHNMGLVHYCVNQIIGKNHDSVQNNSRRGRTTTTTKQFKKLPLNSLSREDLVQEGAIGLARAVDKWDPAIAAGGGKDKHDVDRIRSGNKFSTYAYYWIRAAILRAIAERDDLMRVPSHVSQAVNKINKAASRLGLELEGTSSGIVSSNSLSWREANAAKKLAEEAGLTDRNFKEAMKVRRRRYGGGYVPFEQWMQNGLNLQTDVTDLNAIASTSAASSVSDDEHDEHAEQVRTVLSKFLRPKEMEALSWRYGLLRDDVVVNQVESPTDRANRQFAEMEDQLFGETVASASALVSPSNASPTKALNAPSGKAGEAMSFVDVGKRMEVSAEYTRRLCHRALDKLRSAAADGQLEPAFLL